MRAQPWSGWVFAVSLLLLVFSISPLPVSPFLTSSSRTSRQPGGEEDGSQEGLGVLGSSGGQFFPVVFLLFLFLWKSSGASEVTNKSS